MIDTLERRPEPVVELVAAGSRSGVLERVASARAAEQVAAREVLVGALEWARLHPAPAPSGERVSGEWLDADRMVPLAGPGAPGVSDFAVLELGGHLGLTRDAARDLVGDALELGHRLPILWGNVLAGVVPAWRARLVARATRGRGLNQVMVARVDAALASDPTRLTGYRIAQVVEEAVLWVEPDRAVAEEQAALADRGVRLRPAGSPAVTDVHMRLDADDAAWFDHAVAGLADRLAQLGDTDPVEVRRAKAVGILADPQQALELWWGVDHDDLESAAADAHVRGRPLPRRRDLRLFVHLTPTGPDTADAVVVERAGALTRQALGGWLGAADSVRITPVIDLAGVAAVDAHDPPAWMREQVVQADATCVFPACTRDSRSADLDHIDPYQPLAEGGPPGQTTPANLAPLCRGHHRLKTHGGWSYQRLTPGHYAWITPQGDLIETRTRRRRP